MMKILAGRSNINLASDIAGYVGETLTPVKLSKFKDGEHYVKINESVRGQDVFIIQSTCSPVNDNVMELLLLIDAAKRASARSITAVIPYYGYARQDRKAEPREPVSSRLVADLIETAGADRVLTIDIHSPQQQGFFDVPMDDLWAAPLFKSYFKKLDNVVVVSPDAGGAPRARHLAKLMDSPIAIIDKRRQGHNQSEVVNILGDVKGKNAIILDDMIDTGGTISGASSAIKKAGAKKVYIAATHAVFSDDAAKKMNASSAEEVVVTNTIPVKSEGKIKVISVTPLLGEAVKKIYKKESVSALAEAQFQTRLIKNEQ